MLVGLQAANARLQALWQDLNLLSHFEVAIEQGTGDDGAEARQGEDAVNRQAWAGDVLPLLRGGQHLLQLGKQVGYPLHGIGRDRDDGGVS